jgi:hypothetical protein
MMLSRLSDGTQVGMATEITDGKPAQEILGTVREGILEIIF